MGVLEGEKVLIAPSSFAAVSGEPMELLISTGAEIIDNPFKRRLSKQEITEILRTGITGMIAGLEPLDKEVMSGSVLKVISRCGSGTSNVDLEAAKEMGIIVKYTPDAPVASVAELSLGALLGLLRRIPFMDRDLHEGKWTKKIGGLLEGKTVVIIGFGRIGRYLARLLASFRVKIIAVDPFLEEEPEGIKVMSLEKALPLADIVSVHSSGDKCILNGKEFDVMKRGVILLNAARGSVVNEKALITALEEGRVSGAWLDVFDEEPYSGPLTGFSQVILTPHVGSYTAECRNRMETEAVENLINGFKEIKEGKV